MKKFNFPGGEVHVELERAEYNWATLEGASPKRWDLWSSDDIMSMLLFHNVVPARYFSYLDIPYIPYARQDRRTSRYEPCSIEVMAQLINSLKAKKVRIFDPHSDVAPALINNVEIIESHQILRNIQYIDGSLYDGIVCPDAGAEKKVFKVAQELRLPMYRATKHRCTKTGEITHISMVDLITKDGRYLVVDDICDGGRTFVELAKTIHRHSPADVELSLYVTHGIFSKGLVELFKYYDYVYTANLRDDLLKKVWPTTLFVIKV